MDCLKYAISIQRSVSERAVNWNIAVVNRLRMTVPVTIKHEKGFRRIACDMAIYLHQSDPAILVSNSRVLSNPAEVKVP